VIAALAGAPLFGEAEIVQMAGVVQLAGGHGRLMSNRLKRETDMKIMTTAAALAVMLAVPALAQDKPIEFRLIAAKTNPVGCNALDASMSRVANVTRKGDAATIKSAGGIDDTLKQKTPNVYTTVFSLGGVKLDIVADASVSPATLTVSEAQRGCKWNAVAR
jgi:hypothetical protein